MIARPETYTQCNLCKGDAVQTVWVPTAYAVLGETLRIKVDGVWQSGWKVDRIFDTQLAEVVERRNRDYLKQRKATDI